MSQNKRQHIVPNEDNMARACSVAQYIMRIGAEMTKL